MKKVIELQNIKRDFQVGEETVHALRGVSFTINEGEFVTIMGTSGSGKSTLLNTLGCLDTPTSGEYLLDDISVRTMSKPQRAVLRNRKIGFVFQSYNLLPKTTAVENVELPLMYNSSVSASERRRRAIEALQAVGLGDRLEHKSNQMSGGQMQRVAIARALVNNPAVILADEATGNLDTRTSFDILVLFQKLHAEGRTIIFVTHDRKKLLQQPDPNLHNGSSHPYKYHSRTTLPSTAHPNSRHWPALLRETLSNYPEHKPETGIPADNLPLCSTTSPDYHLPHKVQSLGGYRQNKAWISKNLHIQQLYCVPLTGR